ncbi:peroxiredoxin-like family protein [Streptomyces sp. NPDC055299]
MTTPDTLLPGPRPGARMPDLSVPLAGGSTWNLADQSPERFSLIVFYRGLHCPLCKAQLRELDRHQDELSQRGIEAIAISADTQERAEKTLSDWGIKHLPIGYGLTETTMREWGLYVSRRVKDTEPELFNEPGLFLVRPDQTLFYTALNTMPFGRPRLDDLLAGIDFAINHNYPARGER